MTDSFPTRSIDRSRGFSPRTSERNDRANQRRSSSSNKPNDGAEGRRPDISDRVTFQGDRSRGGGNGFPPGLERARERIESRLESRSDSRARGRGQNDERQRNILERLRSRLRDNPPRTESPDQSASLPEVGVNPVGTPELISPPISLTPAPNQTVEEEERAPDTVSVSPVGTPVEIPSQDLSPEIGTDQQRNVTDNSDQSKSSQRLVFRFNRDLEGLGRSLRIREQLTESASQLVEKQIDEAKNILRADQLGQTRRADEGREELTDLILEQQEIENQLRSLNGDEQVELDTEFVEKLSSREGLKELIAEKEDQLDHIDKSLDFVDSELVKVERQISRDISLVKAAKKRELSAVNEASPEEHSVSALLGITAEELAVQLSSDIRSTGSGGSFGDPLQAHSGLEYENVLSLLS